MFNYFRKELDWGGRKLVLETGKIARQADGAVMISYGETIVLCTAVGVKSAKPGQDFFPLTVNYQEKAFAAGKIPGGFFKREGRPSEAEVLKSRLIDRPIRPLFPEGFRNEVQIVATVLSYDNENDPDIVSMVGCSAALTLSGIPFFGPIGAARVGYQDGQYILNPTLDQMKTSQLELVLAGTAEGVLMVESEAQELSEEVMLGAVKFGHDAFQPVINAIIELAEHAAKDPWPLTEKTEEEQALAARVDAVARAAIAEAYQEKVKQARYEKVAAAKQAAVAALAAEGLDSGEGQGSVPRPGSRCRPQRHPGHRHPHRRPRHPHRPPDHRRGRHPAARARLRAVHPRRDAGVLRRHPGHRPGRAGRRRAAGRIPREFHAALQFPAVLGG